MNNLFSILNKAIIITLSPLLITTAALSNTREASGNQIGETIYVNKEIKQLELGSDTFGIVFDDQELLGTDDFLTAGSDESLFELGTDTYTGTGMLGQGGLESNNFTATSVDLNQDGTADSSGYIKEIEMGEYFSGAITHEYADENDTTGLDKMYMWGTDVYGATIPELGEHPNIHETKTFATPVSIDINGDGVDGMTDSIGFFSIGIDHASALVETSSKYNNYHFYSWGVNDKGQVGTGDYSAYVAPYEIELNNFMQDNYSVITFEEIEYGNKVSYAVVNDSYDGNDHLYAWGDNSEGQLGFVGKGSDKIYTEPTELILDEDERDMEILDIAAGATATFALTKSKPVSGQDDIYHVYAWGKNEKSIMGTPASGAYFRPDESYAPTELDVDGDSTGDSAGIVRDIEVNPIGYNFYASVYNADEDLDHLYAWGDNTTGQIGWWESDEIGTETSQPQDLDINGDGVQGTVDNIYQVTAGRNSAAAMFETRDGSQQKVYMWGDNSQGQFGWGEDEGEVEEGNSINGSVMVPQLVYQTNIQNMTGDDLNQTSQWLKILLIILTIIAVLLLIILIII